MKSVLLALCLISIAFSYTYNIQSVSQCLTYTTGGACSKWSQSGSISYDTSCFIGQTLVKQQNKGLIQMKDLKAGDFLLTLKNGKQTWSKVQGWIHRTQKMMGSYKNITLKNGEWLGVSDRHNIAFVNKQSLYEYKFPIDETSNALYPCMQEIQSKSIFTYQGLYAPLTSQNSYLVYTSKGTYGILAHDFAQIRNPEFYSPIANSIFEVSKIFNGEHALNGDGMHVAADWMKDNFAFLME